MKKQASIPGLKGRPFNGRLYPKPKHIRQEPRQKIRQLLRSFVPLERSIKTGQTSQESKP